MAGERAPVAVVTGGASGIGAAVARRMLDDGYRVAIFDRAAPSVEESSELSAFTLDVRDEDQVRRALDAVAERWGGLDAVVHSAAIAQHGEPARDLPAAAFRELLDVNVLGSFVVARAAAELMGRTGGGSIVLLSSPSAFRARPGMAAYSASKAGVIALTQCLAVEFAASGIRVNCVSPGVTLTPLMLDSWGARDAEDAFRMADAQAHIPLGRLVVPEEVAATVAYLNSPGASAITGHNLVVDGGRSL